MQRVIEKTEDTAQYVVGAPIFPIVAGLTALVMAIGFPVIETIERLRHHAP
jgi:hypothetical protein